MSHGVFGIEVEGKVYEREPTTVHAELDVMDEKKYEFDYPEFKGLKLVRVFGRNRMTDNKPVHYIAVKDPFND